MSFVSDRFINRIDNADNLRAELDRINKDTFLKSYGFEMYRELIRRQDMDAVFDELRAAVERGGTYQNGIDYSNVEDLIQTIIIRLKKGT